MPKDNTLGAPTEGLGQTVTFAAEGGRGTPQMQPVQRQALRNNPASSGAQLTAQALQVPPSQPDQTLAVLMRLGGEVLKPRLEAERTRMYVEGMQKAAQGQAISEIVDEQPWYSKMFGATSLVDGARAYSASASANATVVDIEANMKTLRKMSADEFSQYAAKRLTDAKTGDPITDAMAMQQMVQHLPTVMKSQAKNHYIFQQEQLLTAHGSAMDASLAVVGQMDAKAREPKTSGAGPLGDASATDDGDRLQAQLEATRLVTTVPDGMDPILHQKQVAKSVAKALNGGNFAAYETLKSAGYLQTLDPTLAHHIEVAYSQASNKAKLTMPSSILDKVADFRTLAKRPGVSDEDIHAAAANINAEYTQTTGDKAPLLGQSATLTELQQLREYRDAEQSRLNHARETATSKTEKELAAIAAVSNLASRVAVGDGTRHYLMSGETPKERQEVFDHLRLTATPETRARVMVEQVDVAVDQTEKGNVESAIGEAKRSADPALLYEVYRTKYLPLVQAAGDNAEYVAQKYAGEHGKEMAKYHALAQGREVDAAQQAAFYSEVVTPRAEPLPETKKTKEVVAAFTNSSLWAKMPFTGEYVRDPEGYAAELAPKMKHYLSTADAIKDAKLALPNLNLIGGYHWKKSVEASDLTTWIAKNKVAGGVAPDNLGEALSITVKQYSKEAGIEGEAQIGQTSDGPGKEPRLYLMGMGTDGKARILPFPASDLHKVWKTGINRLTSDDFRFGPETTWGQVPDDMPSPYAGDKEWEAYRARQAARKAQPTN